MRKYIVFLLVTAIVLFSAISQPHAYATGPPRRLDECTCNSQLSTAWPTTWDPYVWLWGIGYGERGIPNVDNHAYWTTDGVVDTHCQDTGPFDATFLAVNFDQTKDQGLIEVDLATTSNLWLEGSYSDLNSFSMGIPCWTGAKFDIKVTDKTTGNIIFMESYIDRTGINLVWGNEYARKLDPSSNEWGYMVGVDTWKTYAKDWTGSGGKHYYVINLLGLLQRGIPQLNSMPLYAPDPPFDIRNFKLTKVDFCLESGNIACVILQPWQAATLNSLRVRYNTADINGDGTVDVLDAIFLSNHFNTKLGDSNYDFRADLNTDGQVDIFDSIILASHFGTHY